jgi:hypothetical protein
MARLMAIFNDSVLGRRGAGGAGVITLYGSEGRPESIVLLRPRESVRIRARSAWHSFTATTGSDWVERSVGVRASVEFWSDKYYAPVLSSNVVPLILRSR